MSAFSTERSGLLREAVPAALVGLASLGGYLFTLAPTVASNDAGRFQVAAPLLGTGHPTGYPTFILAGKLFTSLPVGDVAYRVNLMAAVFGAAAVVLLFLVARGLGAGRAPAAGAALLFAFSGTFWSQATLGEVYTMHAFFVLLVTLLLLRWRRRGGFAGVVAAALIYGLSFGNNAGVVLFGLMFAVLLLFGGQGRVTLRVLVSGAAAFLVGLSVYAYLPIRGFAGAWHNFGDPVNNWTDVWNLASGARFQGLMDPSPGSVFGEIRVFLAEVFSQAPAPFGYALPVLVAFGAVFGLVRLVVRGEAAVAVAVGAGLVIPLFYALSYGIDDVAVYYLPVYLVAALLFAVGITGAAGLLGAAGGGIAFAPLLLGALLLGLNFAPSDRSEDYEERELSEKTLASLPDDAILYGKVQIVPMAYLIEIEGERPDVVLRWLDGRTLDENFERDVASGRAVYFISDESYTGEYLPAAEEIATSSREGDLISFTPR
ncbi:protein O-mannosyl-transferase family [Rubrobacter indicoceani]|uniref:protein O-mannosyl-transferase family n=1 Tax=Rubrobacter indicoceani TaxID=2051957 RepID=UPI0013C46EAC|nr:DUF2723 domain-containing protein [Rubrobacter indicoceani]